MSDVLRRLQPVFLLALLAACGGGDGDGGGLAPPPPTAPANPGISYTPGVFPAAATFANRCQAPRTGTDPATSRPWPDVQGTTLHEKHFLRSWTNHTYLWFDEVAERDPASVTAVLDYFATQKTTAVLPNGRARDEFHFTWDTAEYYALSQSGVSVGYGISWDLVRGTPPRRLVVQFVQPGSQAAAEGVERGAEILTVDGVDLVNDNTQAGINTLNTVLFNPPQGSSHTFTFRLRSGANGSANLTAAAVVLNPVPLVRVIPTDTGNLGYIQFDDHIATAEQRLIDAVNQLKAGNVQDLVLDLRYNGGGYLAIASQLAYMVAGPAQANGRIFERVMFNSKHAVTNPVTGQPLVPMPFASQTVGLSVPSGQTLPTLDLSRVYVITTDDTCSASEAIINGLRGIGVEVIQIGGDTCGKPYGFYPEDNCGTTYFSVQFKGVNELGFGDYAAGFSPVVRPGQPAGAKLPGCEVADDYAHDLGDTEERMLKVALDYRANNRSCALASSFSEGAIPRVQPSAAAASIGDGLALEQPAGEPWRNNRIYR